MTHGDPPAAGGRGKIGPMDRLAPTGFSDRVALRPPRFLLLGDIGGEASFHLGDEAMLQANLERLRELFPGAALTVASRDPAWSSRLYGVAAVPRLDLSRLPGAKESVESWLHRLVAACEELLAGKRSDPPEGIPEETVRALAESDGLLISGGGNLNTSWLDQLYERLFLLALADRLGVPSVLTGQTLGPHIEPREREILRQVLRSVRLVAVREPYSLVVARALGVPMERTAMHLDDAFFLPRGEAGPAERSGWIAVTVTRFSGPLEPLAAQLGAVALETGRRLILVPHAKQPDDDIEQARRVLELLHPSVRAEAVDVPSSERGRWLVDNADLVLSMRYHPLVFAVAGGVPALGIYVDEYTRVKLRGALGHGGVQDWVVPIEMALDGRLSEAALDLWERRHAVAARLTGQAERWRAMESEYRDRFAAAFRTRKKEEVAPQDLESATSAWRDLEEGAPHRPRSGWARLGAALERRADSWFHDRMGLVEQVDRAVEYALSLEATLTERDREVSGLKEVLRARGGMPAEESEVDVRVDGGP